MLVLATAGSNELTDRRSARRYPIEVGLSFSLRTEGPTVVHRGKTIDISSCGILFETDARVPVDAAVQVLLAWPATLDGRAALQVRVEGWTVRRNSNCVAVRFKRYEFLTRRRQT